METKLTEKRHFEVKRGMVFFLNRPAEAQQPISCISEFTPEKKRKDLIWLFLMTDAILHVV